ncbi:hypothetical protein GCM10020331_039000 [Ectobacillus funiculus]
MTNRIPEEVIEQVRRSVDIVDVIGEYVQLRKQGRNYFWIMSFSWRKHTFFFSVSADKQIFFTVSAVAKEEILYHFS